MVLTSTSPLPDDPRWALKQPRRAQVYFVSTSAEDPASQERARLVAWTKLKGDIREIGLLLLSHRQPLLRTISTRDGVRTHRSTGIQLHYPYAWYASEVLRHSRGDNRVEDTDLDLAGIAGWARVLLAATILREVEYDVMRGRELLWRVARDARTAGVGMTHLAQAASLSRQALYTQLARDPKDPMPPTRTAHEPTAGLANMFRFMRESSYTSRDWLSRYWDRFDGLAEIETIEGLADFERR